MQIYLPHRRIHHASSIDAYSMTFDGVNEYVNTNKKFTDIFTSGLGNTSYAFWLKTTAADNMSAVIATTGSANKVHQFKVNIFAPGDITFTSEGALGWRWLGSAATNITNGNWHHICLTLSSWTPHMYVDGVLSDGTAVTGGTGGFTSANDTQNIYYGLWAASYLSMSLYQVVFFDKALSAGEVAELYTLNQTDLRTSFSAAANIKWYHEFSTGLASFPSIPELIIGTSSTAINMEVGDITTDVP